MSSIPSHEQHAPADVVLTGTYCGSNRGDSAMQQVMARAIAGKGLAAVIASPFPDHDSRHHAPTPVIRSRRRNLPLATFHLAVLAMMHLLGRPPKQYPLDAEIDAMARARCVVDLSGDMLTEDYGLLVGYSHLLPLLQARLLGKPLLVCAQSVGPFHHLRRVARHVLGQAVAVTVREPISLDYLAALLPAGSPLTLTSDLAFLLPPAPPECGDALLAGAGMETGHRPILGVSVSALLSNRRNRNLANSTTDLVGAFARALDAVARERKVDILLVPHVFGPGAKSDDRTVVRQVATRMTEPSFTISGTPSSSELKALIARCHAFVGCRMHANIAALDSGVPTLAISYSHKTQGIMRLLGLSRWVIGIESLDEALLRNGILALLDANNEYRAQLAEALPQARKKAGENIETVLHFARSNAS